MYGSYTNHFIRQTNEYGAKVYKSGLLRRLVLRAIKAGDTVTIGKARIADIRLDTHEESLVYYHGNEKGEIIYRDDDGGYPIVGGIRPDTAGYYEVYEQVKKYRLDGE